MTANDKMPVGSVVPLQPTANADVNEWVDWYLQIFLPGWIRRAHDPDSIGFFDELDQHGQPAKTERRSVLAQARLLFTFSHLALISGNPAFGAAARIARNALPAFRKSPGLYCRARASHGGATGLAEDDFATSYDQSFVILGLSTWGRLQPDEDVSSEMEGCWSVVETTLCDPATGLMLEHDGIADPAHNEAPHRAQNPHMHLYEAALQAFEMTGRPEWLDRASRMRAKGLEFFFDADTGTIIEFIAPDLSHLPGREGQRREVGHQCEWAWLLMREADLGGDPSVRDIAKRLLKFSDQHGFQADGVMQGAAFDAISADSIWHDTTFLLWPQTEAIKAHAIRSDDPQYAARGQSLALMMFKRYFEGRAAFANQLDQDARPIWADALSRLHYHIVMAVTEGARAGLWNGPVQMDGIDLAGPTLAT